MTPVLAHAGDLHPGEWYWFSFDPIVAPMLLLMSLLYLRARRVLGRRGRTIPVPQQVAWWMGITLIAIGTMGPLDSIGGRTLVSAHMAQHLLIADLAAPLLLMGTRAPVGMFLWPRPVASRIGRSRIIRGTWSFLTHPPVAIAVWLVVLYFWHVPAMYEAALENRWVHDIQHFSFMASGVISWWPMLDPTHRTVSAPMWKPFYLGIMRGFGTSILGAYLIFSPRQVYTFYGDAPLALGVDPLLDQQVGGAMMMAVDLTMVITGFVYFMLRAAAIDTGELPQGRAAEHAAARSIRRERDPITR